MQGITTPYSLSRIPYLHSPIVFSFIRIHTVLPSKPMSSTDYTDLIAIDYGTSYSTAWFKCKRDGTIQKLVFNGGSFLCPSVVQYQSNGGVVCVGEAAERLIGKGTVQGIVRSSKRLMGRQYSDEIVLRSLESCCSPIVNRDGRPTFEVFPYVYKTPTDVATDIFKYIVMCAETVQQSKFTRCSITAPVYFASTQRIEISKAAEAAGLSVVCFSDEPCAAAFAYIHSLIHSCSKETYLFMT